MNDSPYDLPPGNPFSTRNVRPGSIAYLFPSGDNAESVVGRLRENDWKGAVVGPHGSGKSTLLATLQPVLVSHGRDLVRFTLRDGQRCLPAETSDNNWHAHTLLVIDGYEQLSRASRRQLFRMIAQKGSGLLITTHDAPVLLEVFRTGTDIHAFRKIARSLASSHHDGEQEVITNDQIDAAFARHEPDLREALFELYDRFEEQRSH